MIPRQAHNLRFNISSRTLNVQIYHCETFRSCEIIQHRKAGTKDWKEVYRDGFTIFATKREFRAYLQKQINEYYGLK